jgi:hypothetical protein
MKKNVLTVLVIAAMAALLWFIQSRKQIEPALAQKGFQGEWQLDSLAFEKQGPDSLGLLITALLGGEQSIHFSSDTTLQWLSKKDSSQLAYQLTNSLLQLIDPADTSLFQIRSRTDTTMQWFHTKDSTAFFWKKKR